jgi:hypothetical protein
MTRRERVADVKNGFVVDIGRARAAAYLIELSLVVCINMNLIPRPKSWAYKMVVLRTRFNRGRRIACP